MNCKIIIDKEHEEEVLIYAHEKSKLVEEIDALISRSSLDLMGYQGRDIVKLNVSDVYCFTTEDNKVYALTEKGKVLLKQRLYQLEELLDEGFVKINQSSIANIKRIKKFDASFSGSMLVIFDNGHRDYVSRRQLKAVKERLGL